MKASSFTPLFPATTIAAGISAIVCTPSQAADYSYVPSPNPDDWAYTDTRIQLPDLDRAYRPDAPAYHYAYYAIARPEYLL
jgi:hypothetical protein